LGGRQFGRLATTWPSGREPGAAASLVRRSHYSAHRSGPGGLAPCDDRCCPCFGGQWGKAEQPPLL